MWLPQVQATDPTDLLICWPPTTCTTRSTETPLREHLTLSCPTRKLSTSAWAEEFKVPGWTRMASTLSNWWIATTPTRCQWQIKPTIQIEKEKIIWWFRKQTARITHQTTCNSTILWAVPTLTPQSTKPSRQCKTSRIIISLSHLGDLFQTR